MLQFILKRVLMIIPVMFGVSVIVFGIMELTPGDPVLLMLGERAPIEQQQQLRERLGRQGRERVLDAFTWDHVADRVAEALIGVSSR